MRDQILKILRTRMPQPVSGEELSGQLGVSRTAIWKHIQALKAEGYVIDSVVKKGYILRQSPDKLLPGEIAARLKTKWLGREVTYKETLRSTNELAKQLAGNGCRHGMTVVAEEQSSGHGRLSRGWFSPYGHGCWVSVVLRPPFLPQEAAKCTLMAAVAVVQAINKYKGVQAFIKWPNDVLLNGKKMVGILTEISAEFGKINYIVIGTGININVPKKLIPPELQATAVSLMDVAQEPVSRLQVLTDYLQNLETLYELVLQKGFEPVFDLWRQFSGTLGQRVKVIAPDSTYCGLAVDIDRDGLLIVKKDDGSLEKVIAGDVSIRPVEVK